MKRIFAFCVHDDKVWPGLEEIVIRRSWCCRALYECDAWVDRLESKS